MEIKFKNTYKIEVKKEYLSSFELDFKEWVTSECMGIDSEDTLVEYLYDYILYSGKIKELDSDDENSYILDSSDLEILNIEEFKEKYNYLIVPNSKKDSDNCCKYEYGNFCSTCGTLLKDC